jgi:hypothetical protein
MSPTDGNSGARETIVFSDSAALRKLGGGTRMNFGD